MPNGREEGPTPLSCKDRLRDRSEPSREARRSLRAAGLSRVAGRCGTADVPHQPSRVVLLVHAVCLDGGTLRLCVLRDALAPALADVQDVRQALETAGDPAEFGCR